MTQYYIIKVEDVEKIRNGWQTGLARRAFEDGQQSIFSQAKKIDLDEEIRLWLGKYCMSNKLFSEYLEAKK